MITTESLEETGKRPDQMYSVTSSPLRVRNRSALFGIALLVLSALSPGNAMARTEVLRWTHSRAGEVVRWEAHVGASIGNYDQVLTLPDVQPDALGVYQASIQVPDAATVFIALRAIGPNGVQSPLSNARERAPTIGGGGGGGGGGSTIVPIQAGQTIPPSANAVQREDFLGSPLGNAADGWVDTRANSSLAVDDSLFGVIDIGGDRALSTSSALSDIHSHLVGTAYTWSNMTLSGRMAIDRDDASIGVTAYSQFATVDRYYRLGRSGAGAFTISGHPSLGCANASTGVIPEAGRWYSFRLSVTSEANLNRIQAKVWAQGTPEPSGPQAECTDGSTNRASAGTIGVWASGQGQKAWDDIEVTTTNSTPPPPLGPPILIEVVPAPQ